MTKPLLRKADCIRLSVPDLEAGLSYDRDRLGLTTEPPEEKH